MLSLVNLPHKEDSYPHELSGGEQQRVALARTLVLEPDLLLLDEPFSNIDAGLKASIRTELKRILTETNSTCLIVTHDLEDAKAIADQIIDISNPETPIKTRK
jgi:iron(III) transport system ATP-binding protein